MTSAHRHTTVRPRVANRRLLYLAPVAAVGAAFVNAVIFFIGSSLGAFPQDVFIQMDMPMTLLPVMSLSALAVLVASLVFALLGRFTKQPVRNFVILTALVLAVMAAPPFTIAGAPSAMIVALQLTHLSTAAIAAFALLRWGVAR